MKRGPEQLRMMLPNINGVSEAVRGILTPLDIRYACICAGHQGGLLPAEHFLPHAGTSQPPSTTGTMEGGCMQHTL